MRARCAHPILGSLTRKTGAARHPSPISAVLSLPTMLIIYRENLAKKNQFGKKYAKSYSFSYSSIAQYCNCMCRWHNESKCFQIYSIEQCSATTDDGHYFLFFPKIVMRTYVSLIKLSDIYGKTNFRLWQHLFLYNWFVHEF